VTGSSAGLGETTVKMLAAEGANVVLHGRNEGRAKTVAEAIRVAGGRTDVTLDHRTFGRVITRA
jgi:NADP-dependent 3-hydroxy acid dehydrogenase YdfG